MPVSSLASQLTQRCGVEVVADQPLAPLTSLGVGGPAEAFLVARDVPTLARIVTATRELGCPLTVLGGGTNLLIADAGVPGLTVQPGLRGLTVGPEGRITVGGGAATDRLVEATQRLGLAGLAFAAGLPGTVGGALAGNAGCFGHTLSERLVALVVITAGGDLVTLTTPQDGGFSYRGSRLRDEGAIIVEATFGLEPDDADAIAAEAAARRADRRERHPAPGTATAGSWFQNLPPETPGGPRRAAGALLDAVGAKSLSVGDAAVFEKHANILVNRGQASATDFLALERLLAQRVYEQFGVWLEPEVRLLGAVRSRP